MKVSVVIPTYNEADYIEPTLFHIKRANPYEIIVSDSNSSDETRNIAKKYGARVVFCKKENAAIGRNTGARIARGDIILFLDADTIVYPNILDIIKKDFSKNIIGWSCSIYAFSYSRRQQLGYALMSNTFNFVTALGLPHSPGIVLAFPKQVFEQLNGFREDYKTMEDMEIVRRAGKLGKFKFSKYTCVFTSTRRSEDYGISKLLKNYVKSYLRYIRKHEPITDYPYIR